MDYEERVMFANLGGTLTPNSANIGGNLPNSAHPGSVSNGLPPSCSPVMGGGGGGTAGGGGGGVGGPPSLLGGICNPAGLGVNSGGLGNMGGSSGGSYGGYAGMGAGYNALTQIKRQTQSLSDDVSSGYGSPSPSSL